MVGKNGRLITVSNDNFTTSGSVELLSGPLTAAAGKSALYAVNQSAGKIQELDASNPQLPAVGPLVSVGSPIVTPVVAPDGSLYVGIPRTGAVGHVMKDHLAVIKGISEPDAPLAVVLAGTQPVVASLDAAVVTPLGATAVSAAVPAPASARPIEEGAAGSDSLNGVVGAVGPHSVDSANVRTTAAVTSTPLPSWFSASGAAMQGPNMVLIDKVNRDVLFVNTASRTTRTLQMPGKLPPNQLTVQDGLVFVNASDGPSAMVINGAGQWKPVTKYTTLPPPHPKPATLPPPPPPRTPPPARKPRYVKPEKPGAPSNPAAVAGNGTAAVSWGPAPDNGSRISHYLLTWSGNGAAGRATLPGTTLGKTVTGLADGSAYTFAIQAENAVGRGPAVTAGPVTPSSTTPAAPAAVQAATPTDNGSVSLSWTEPDNGDAIKSYTVTEAGTGQVVATGVTGTSTTIAGVVTAASPAFGPVSFEVAAIDGASRTSAPSAPSAPVTPYLGPLAPAVAVSGYTQDGSTATLSVSCQAGCYRGNVRSYTVTLSGGAQPVNYPAPPDGTPVQIPLTGLTPNTPYTAQVTAQDAVNTAGQATPVSLTTMGPPIVTGVTVSPVSVGVGAGAEVDVTAAVNPGGEALSACTVSVTLNSGGTGTGTCGQPIAIGVPMYNTSYTATVTASNQDGPSTAPPGTGAGTSSLKTLTADASIAFGTCPNTYNGSQYCGGDSNLQPGPAFTAPNGPLVTQGTTVTASCWTTGGADAGEDPAYPPSVKYYDWVQVETPAGNGLHGRTLFPQTRRLPPLDCRAADEEDPQPDKSKPQFDPGTRWRSPA